MLLRRNSRPVIRQLEEMSLESLQGRRNGAKLKWWNKLAIIYIIMHCLKMGILNHGSIEYYYRIVDDLQVIK